MEGRVAHELHHRLTRCVRTEVDGFELRKLGLNSRVEVVEVQVATAKPALAKESFRDGMEGG